VYCGVLVAPVVTGLGLHVDRNKTTTSKEPKLRFFIVLSVDQADMIIGAIVLELVGKNKGEKVSL
jgi:hypothetical protein